MQDPSTSEIRFPIPVNVTDFRAGIPNLFHVVFHDYFRNVTIYDNQLKKASGPYALVGTH